MKARCCVTPRLTRPMGLMMFMLLLFGSACVSTGDTRTWNGSYSAYWSAAANWDENIAPAAGDDLVFPGGADNRHNYNNLGNVTFGSITISDTGYTLDALTTGATIGLSGGLDATASGSVNWIELNIDLAGAQGFNVSPGSGNLFINGDVNLQNHTLTMRGDGYLHLAGTLSGTGDLVKTGMGMHWLQGDSANTYTGSTYINQGTLKLAKTVLDGAITAGNIYVGNGVGAADSAILRADRNYQIGNVPITIDSDGWLDMDDCTDNVGAITFNGGHAGSGAGMLGLIGDVTVNATDSEALLDGTLNLSGIRTFDVESSYYVDIGLRVNAVVSGSGFRKTGGGKMLLAGDNTFTGEATVDDGWLYIEHDHALGTTDGGSTVTDTGTMYLNGSDIAGEPLTLDPHSFWDPVLYVYSSSSWSGDIVLNYDSEIHTYGPLELSGAISGSGGITKEGTGSLTLSGPTDNVYTGPTLVNNGRLLLNKSSQWAIGYGRLTVGDFTGEAGSAVVRALGNYQLSSIPITVNSDGLFDLNNCDDTVGNRLTLSDGGEVQTGAGTLTLGADSRISVNAPDEACHISGNIDLGSGACTLAVEGFLTVYATMSGSADITKTGGGYLSLYGANSFSGTMTVNEGYLGICDSLALGSAAAGTYINNSARLALYFNSHVSNEPLTMNSSYSPGSLFAGSSGSNSWSGPVTLAQDTTARVDTGGFLNISGPVSGAGGLAKLDEGTLILSGYANNTYTGSTVVEAGRLLLNKTIPHCAVRYGSLTVGDGSGAAGSALVQELNIAQLGPVPIIVNADGLLDLNNRSDEVGSSLTLNGRGDVQTGTGMLTLRGDSRITVNAPSAASSISGHISVGSGACTVDVADGMLSVDAAVSGAASITKTGGGTLLLSSANSFAGTMAVDQGQLTVQDPGALGSEAAGTAVNNGARLTVGTQVGNEPLTMDSTSYRAIFCSYPSGSNSWAGPVTLVQDTTVEVYGSYSMELGGIIGGPGGLTKTGTGVLTLSGPAANTYSGPTAVDEGMLVLDQVSGNSIPRDLIVAEGAAVRQEAASRIGDDVIIYGSGLYDMNGWNETIGDLVLYDGADFDSGGATLTLAGDVTVDGGVSILSGNLELYAGTRGFDILYHGLVPWPGAHCYLNAAVSGNGNLVKTGPGSMRISGSNSYTGTTAVEQGIMMLESDTALGSATGGTTVDPGCSIYLSLFSPAASRNITGEHLSVGGTLYSCGVADRWDAPVIFTGDVEIKTADSKSLELSGALGGAGGLTKTGDGILVFSGPADNTYAGDTRVNSGTLVLNKSTGTDSVPGHLYIGDGVGGVDADVVRMLAGTQIPSMSRITVAASGLFDMNSRTEHFGSLAGSGHVTLGSGDLGCGQDNTSSEFSGIIEGSGGLIKYGSGAFTLSGNNSYSGDTVISAGTLRVNGVQPSSDVVVNLNGILGGIGTVGGITSSGVVAPGVAAGALSTGRTATLNSGSAFNVELNGYQPAGYDRLDVCGKFSPGNADLNVSWGFVPAVGDAFTIIDNDDVDAVVGTFNGLAEGALLTAGNVQLQITYAGGSGNDVVLSAAEVKPLEDLRIAAIASDGIKTQLEWTGGIPFYRVEKKNALTHDTWKVITAPTRNVAASVPADSSNAFYRVSGGHVN